MFKIFKKKKLDSNVYSPVNGTCIDLKDVKDEIFSSKMLGEGYAFILEDGTIYAPCDATIELIAKTKHAIGLNANNGVQLLIHCGLDTVNLNGEGFQTLVKEGQKVCCGDPLLKIDMDFMTSKNIDLTTPMVITNGSDIDFDLKDSIGEIRIKDKAVFEIKR